MHSLHHCHADHTRQLCRDIFDLPKRTEEQAVKGGTSTAPIYRGLAKKGLIRKDYLNGESGTGGISLG